jgi:hypothetical protein
LSIYNALALPDAFALMWRSWSFAMGMTVLLCATVLNAGYMMAAGKTLSGSGPATRKNTDIELVLQRAFGMDRRGRGWVLSKSNPSISFT